MRTSIASRLRPGRAALLLLIAAALVAGAWWTPTAHDFAKVATGFGAKQLCSGVFVSGRQPDQVLASDMVDMPAIVRTSVDRDARSAFARIGPVHREARFREGLGCSLVIDAHDANALPDPPAADDASPTPLPEADVNDSRRLRLAPLVSAAFGEPDDDMQRGTRAVVILHRGELVAEDYAPGFDADTPLPGWSMAKSVVHALTGILLAEDTVALDDGVPGWSETDDHRSDITLRHLLQMTPGLTFDEDYTSPLGDPIRMLFGEPSAPGFVRGKPMAHPPGDGWDYTSGTTNLLVWVLREAVDDDTRWATLPRDALFKPLGMRSAVMETDAEGNFVGSSFMYATARDWARFGLLYLQDGQWQSEQLLPEGWVDFAREPAPHAPDGGYGAHFWLNRGDPDTGERPWPALPPDTYAASGYQGQEVVIVPSADLVVVRLGVSRPREAWDREWFVAGALEILDRLD